MTVKSPLTIVILAYLCLFSAAHAADTKPAVTQEQAPWSLRDHYTFGGTSLNLDYAKDNAEMRLRQYAPESDTSRMEPDLVVRSIGFMIELKDGRIITNDMLGCAGETAYGREPINTDNFGEGTEYSINFAPYEGMIVKHKIQRFMSWSFLLISIEITNTSDAPITFTRIQPITLGAGSVSGLSENASVNGRSYVFRGGCPVYTQDKNASMLFISDPTRNIRLTLGILPSGKANSFIDIQPGGGAWQGVIESSFLPGISVAQGASIQSDQIIFCLDTTPMSIDSQYSWLVQSYSAKDAAKSLPRAWVTIPETHGISTLRSEAESGKAFGITHALIPGNWEGRPGSLEGGAPNYPRNIGDAARSLKDAGVTPGITVDPLLCGGGSDTWIAKSVDGCSWVNPADASGREYTRKRIRKLVEQGFGFVVIEESQIPDEVLLTFNLSRAQAASLAFDIAREAAGSNPVSVLPETSAQLNCVRDEWLAAASAVSRMVEYGVGAAAVRLTAADSANLDDMTLLAMRLWRGPIEFVGAPPRKFQGQLADLFGSKPLDARAQDGNNKAPLSWLFRGSSSNADVMGKSLFLFPGATLCKAQEVEVFSGEERASLFWRVENNTPIQVQESIGLSSGNITTIGAVPESSQPIFAGTAQELTLGLERLKSLVWDGNRGVLSGMLDASSSSTQAFFYIPASMTLESAKMNSSKARAEVNGQWVSLPLPASGGAFELAFISK